MRDFARKGDQEAFASLVRRHLNLVYATAFRKVEDAGGAEEVAQNVFNALARKASRFAPDDSLPAWLHRSALLEAKDWLRHELRRRRREETAAQLGTTMKTPDHEPASGTLIPALDEGLLSLREKDRAALLLRYYESRPLREVGEALGVSEEAARKRVDAALEALSRFFRRRGYQKATVAVTTATLIRTTIAAPSTLATSISQTALQAAPLAVGGLPGVLSRLIGLTRMQTAALCLTVVVVPVGWQWRQYDRAQDKAMVARQNVERVRDQERQLSLTVDRWRAESARIEAALARNNEAVARQAEAMRRVDGLKERLRGLLAAANYRWPDDLPFVRIPKSDIEKLRPIRAIGRTGRIEDWGAELLALTTDEKQQTEKLLRDHTESLAQSAAARAYLTNYLPPNIASHWNGKPHQCVWVPPPAEAAPQLAENLRASVGQILGHERAELLLGSPAAAGFSAWFGSGGDVPKGVLLTVCVDPNCPDGLKYGQYMDANGGDMVSQNANEVRLNFIPDSIATRFFNPWLEGMGITNTVAMAKP